MKSRFQLDQQMMRYWHKALTMIEFVTILPTPTYLTATHSLFYAYVLSHCYLVFQRIRNKNIQTDHRVKSISVPKSTQGLNILFH